jgi:translation initiation factor eIF-2B subunit delta
MRSAGIPVTVIADAAAAAILKTASLVLVGADRVTQDNVVNKIGTRMIATAAREMNIPVYAGCDSSKFIAAAGDEDCDVEHPGAELWPDAPSGVRVLNRYFEPVPLELFSSIVTEWKMLSAEEAGATAGKKELHPLLRTALAQRR